MYCSDVVLEDVDVPNHTIQFVAWSPSGFKCGINYQLRTMFLGEDLENVTRAVCLISNFTGIAKVSCVNAESWNAYISGVLSPVACGSMGARSLKSLCVGHRLLHLVNKCGVTPLRRGETRILKVNTWTNGGGRVLW